MNKWILILAAVCALNLNAGETPAFPAPAPAANDTGFGAGIQRTMTLLATSTAERRNKVRILFYGQSITEQEWSKQVTDDLRKRFPLADLEIENKAIGGFASQILVRVAEHDLYPFYPDLLIFHVYGGNNEYEQIIANARRRTTAEILMQNDHITRWPPEKIDENQDKGAWWDNLMNHTILPEIAKKYGCAIADIRTPWLEYLKTNKLEPKTLLSDDVHLNAHGNFLLAELIKRYLVYKPALLDQAAKECVRTYTIGREVSAKDGKITLDFTGNRVELISGAAIAGQPESARVLIDGKKPSEFPELYVFSRSGPSQTGFWPGILRVSSEKALLLEEWTARITETNPEATHFKFEVTGSRTGADGSGTNTQKFVSNSGRVVIESGDWWLKNAYEWTKKPLKTGFEVKWQVKPLFADLYQAPKNVEASREHVTTVAQGLSNGAHKLEIIWDGKGSVPIQAIRISQPPVK